MTELRLNIQDGFQAWIAESARARSPEVDYGCWWKLNGPREFPRWRVSFIVDTAEVYAVKLEGQRPNEYIVLGKVSTSDDGRADMERRMQGWADGDMRLVDLLGRFENVG